MKLNELVDPMTKGLGVESDIERQAHEFLKHGLKLERAKSRFAATQTTVMIESEA